MNITKRARRVLGFVVLATSIAGAVGAAGAAHADSTVPIGPVPTEAPTAPISDEAPPGVDDSSVAAPTTAPASTTPTTTVPASTAPPSTAPQVAPVPTGDGPMTPQPGTAPVTTAPAIATTTMATPMVVGQQSLLASAPSAPLSPIASADGYSQTIWLYWNPPANDGGAPIIQYQIQWATSANGPWQFFATTTNKYYKASSGNWSNGTRYYFRILASNNAGWGAASTVVSAIPFKVPSAPAYCSAYLSWRSANYYQIHVGWSAGDNGGSPITSYKVTVSKNGFYYTQGVTNVFLATSMDVVVWSPGSYTVTVRAGNAAGYGPACTTNFSL